jgi:hypothetical protein
MGFTLEFIFLYFNAYDSFTRKATIKCLERVRYSEYKLKEKQKLDAIKEEKRKKLMQLQEIKERREAGTLLAGNAAAMTETVSKSPKVDL